MFISWMASQAALWDGAFSGSAKAVLTKISQSSPTREPYQTLHSSCRSSWGRSLIPAVWKLGSIEHPSAHSSLCPQESLTRARVS